MGHQRPGAGRGDGSGRPRAGDAPPATCANLWFRSFCARGGGAANGITSAVQYVREEFEAGMHTPVAELFPPAASTLFAKETVSA